jgi:predicted Fe-Mo cluster-binding NifX family protein
MRIGITSQNYRTVNGHAGKNRRFLIFETLGDGEVRLAERLDLPKAMSLHEYHGEDHPLFRLDTLITGGCGQGFRQRLESRGVRVLTTGETDPFLAAQACAQGRELPPATPHVHAGAHAHQPPSVKLQVFSNS